MKYSKEQWTNEIKPYFKANGFAATLTQFPGVTRQALTSHNCNIKKANPKPRGVAKSSGLDSPAYPLIERVIAMNESLVEILGTLVS